MWSSLFYCSLKVIPQLFCWIPGKLFVCKSRHRHHDPMQHWWLYTYLLSQAHFDTTTYLLHFDGFHSWMPNCCHSMTPVWSWKKKTKNIFKVDNMKCRSFFKRNAFLKSAVFGLLYSSPLLEYIREGKKGNVYHRFLEVQLLTAWDDLPAATWHCHLWLRHFLWEQRRLMSNMVKVCTYHTGSHIHKWLH